MISPFKFFRTLRAKRVFKNLRQAFFNLPSLVKSFFVLKKYRAKLPEISRRAGLAPGCGYIHFVYGIKQQEDFPLYGYIAVKSAQHHNPGWKIVFSYLHEPTGEWWQKLKEDAGIEFVQFGDFSHYGIAHLHHYAHKADVIRLLALYDLGGVYLDVDTLTVRSFASLLEHEFGMAVQPSIANSHAGLCNAVMWGKAKARFARLWLSYYDSFNSKGRDDNWDFHSVRLPWILASTHADWIKILGYRTFFPVLWEDMPRVLLTEGGRKWEADMVDTIGFHLWNGATEKRLRAITIPWIQSSQSLYARYARPVVGDAV